MNWGGRTKKKGLKSFKKLSPIRPSLFVLNFLKVRNFRFRGKRSEYQMRNWLIKTSGKWRYFQNRTGRKKNYERREKNVIIPKQTLPLRFSLPMRYSTSNDFTRINGSQFQSSSSFSFFFFLYLAKVTALLKCQGFL